MTQFTSRLALVAVMALVAVAPHSADAQTTTDGVAQSRVARAYVPPDELVSFPASTPMSQFFRLINPTFVRVTGKRVADPEDRGEPIGVALSGVHFIDAFELVLDQHQLDFRETEGYFIVTEPTLLATTSDGASATEIGAAATIATAAEAIAPPATADTREIRIDAVVFQLNQSRAREVGTNWSALFGTAGGNAAGGAAGGGTGGGAGGGTTGGTTGGATTQQGIQLYVNTSSFFDALDGFIEASGDRISIQQITQLFRYFEEEGFGQTISSPSVTVVSGTQGRMQSGTNIPVTTRDFSGNAIVEYIATGVIIDVLPTYVIDERGDAPVGLIHVNAKVEKSSALPGGAIQNDNASTQVVLLPGEMRAIGGLYTTDESSTRRGVPILRDIPLLKYFFSYRQRQTVQSEIIVVLQARLVDDLRTRQARPLQADIIRAEREAYRDRLNTFNPGAGDRDERPEPNDPIVVEPMVPASAGGGR